MNDLRRILRDGDPARGPEHEGLSAADAAVMRRRVLNATSHPDVARTPWQQPLAVAAMIVLTMAAGVFAGLRFSANEAVSDPPGVSAPREAPRQLQFSTPGGTRIIWVFDPEFSVKEMVP